MSCFSTPVAAAICAAACVAISNGSAAGSSRGLLGRRRRHPASLVRGAVSHTPPAAALDHRTRENRRMAYEFERTHRLAVLGGGPGGYEAALAGAQLGAEVTLVERVGRRRLGRAHRRRARRRPSSPRPRPPTAVGEAADLGVQFFTPQRRRPRGAPRGRRQPRRRQPAPAAAGAPAVRRHEVAARSRPACASSPATGGSTARTASSSRPARARARTDFDEIDADTLVVSVGASPRILPTAKPDGERIFTWTQLYDARRGPRAHDRRRLRCHRRRVRLGLPRARLEGHAGLEPRAGAARRGRRRRARHRGRLQAQRHDGAQQEPRASRSSATATAWSSPSPTGARSRDRTA